MLGPDRLGELYVAAPAQSFLRFFFDEALATSSPTEVFSLSSFIFCHFLTSSLRLLACILITAYEFANGYRAPPWRQIHGDLGYILAKPKDGDAIRIAANVEGVYAIKNDTGDQSSYERTGQVFNSLVALFKLNSPHFASTVDSQVRILRECLSVQFFVRFLVNESTLLGKCESEKGSMRGFSSSSLTWSYGVLIYRQEFQCYHQDSSNMESKKKAAEITSKTEENSKEAADKLHTTSKSKLASMKRTQKGDDSSYFKYVFTFAMKNALVRRIYR